MKDVIKMMGKRLAGVLLFAALFGLLCVFTGKKIYQYNEEGSELMTQLFEMKTLLSSRKIWEERADWIGKEIPRFDTRKGASSHLLKSLGHSLSDYGLELNDHRFYDPETETSLSPENLQSFDRATIEISINGEERDIVEWIHNIQSGGTFTGVDSLSLELGDYGLLCKLEISQWYLGNNRSFKLSEHHQAKGYDLDSGL